MKRLSYPYILLTVIIALSLGSCGEDRSQEFYDLAGANPWIYETMKKNYLWYDEMDKVADATFIADTAQAFIKTVRISADSYSYIENISGNSSSENATSYGFEYEVYNTQSPVVAKVLYTYPASVSAKAGLVRGDTITAVGGTQITSSNYATLLEGTKATTLTLIKGKSTQTIDLPAATTIDKNPVYLSKVLTASGKKIAYLMYNSFTAGKTTASSEYNDNLRAAIKDLSTQGFDDFILDLRYNEGGDISCAQLLGTLLAPSASLGKTFLTATYNDKLNKTINYTLDNNLISSGVNLNLSKIYILTSSKTSGAAEFLINGLKSCMGTNNVILIGTATSGMLYAMESFTNEAYPSYVLHLVVASVTNADGTNDYKSGFSPTATYAENYTTSFGVLGTTSDLFLNTAINTIMGTTSGSTVLRYANNAKQPIYCSLDKNKRRGASLH